MNLYYRCDPGGTNIRTCGDVLEWGAWFQNADRTVARTMTAGGFVSTLFLGLDHSFSMNGPPILFETMTFAEHMACDREQIRTCTRDEALVAHAECLATLYEEIAVERALLKHQLEFKK